MSFIYCSKCRRVVQEDAINESIQRITNPREETGKNQRPNAGSQSGINALDIKIAQVRRNAKRLKELVHVVRALCPENIISEYDYYVHSVRRVPTGSEGTRPEHSRDISESSRLCPVSSVLQPEKPSWKRENVKQRGGAILE